MNKVAFWCEILLWKNCSALLFDLFKFTFKFRAKIKSRRLKNFCENSKKKMFSKAPIKRFNDVTNENPAPVDYDPKEPKSRGSKCALVKSERFLEPKIHTPGPGYYETEQKKIVRQNSRKSMAMSRPMSNLSKCSSRTSSTNSLNTYTEADDDICFKTPSKIPVIKVIFVG